MRGMFSTTAAPPDREPEPPEGHQLQLGGNPAAACTPVTPQFWDAVTDLQMVSMISCRGCS